MSIFIWIILLLLAYFVYLIIPKKWKHTQYGITSLKPFIPKCFSLEPFKVTTADGYIITIFRIRHKSKFNPKKSPILIWHGLGSSAATWIVGGPEDGGALILAEMGFDVYLGNSRGTVYSLEHQSLSIDSKNFWKFSFQQISLDIQATFQLIVKQTQKKAYFIGVSQGSTSFIALLADNENQEGAKFVSGNLKEAFLLCPVVYTKGADFLLLQSFRHVRNLMEKKGIFSFKPKPEKVSMLRLKIWNSLPWLSDRIMYKVTCRSNEMNNLKKAGTFSSFFPHGYSLHCVDHFTQIYEKEGENDFSKFDFGTEENQMMYGQSQAPAYKMENITSKITIYYGGNDKFVPEKNIQLLSKSLINAETQLKFEEKYGHVAFAIGKEMKKFLTGMFGEKE